MDEGNAIHPIGEPPASERTDDNPRSNNPASGWLSWLVLCLVATAALSLTAVHIPPIVKKLGLFAVVYGLLAGWIAAQIAARLGFRMASKTVWCSVVFLVVLAGQIGMAVQSQRVRRAAVQRRLAANPKSRAILAMLESAKIPDDASSQKTAADLRRTIGAEDTSFAGYLQYRVSEIGVESRAGAAAIWIFEIALGSLAATWIFRRLASPDLPAPDLREAYTATVPGRSQESA